MASADHSSIGSIYRGEAEKSLVKATAAGLVLIFLHLLGIQPSEISAIGLKIEIKDPVILYGFVALLYGHYISWALIKSDAGQALYPIRTEPLKFRMTIKTLQRQRMSDKKVRKLPIDHIAIKKAARRLNLISDILIFPYVITVVAIVTISLVISIYDIVNLIEFVFSVF